MPRYFKSHHQIAIGIDVIAMEIPSEIAISLAHSKYDTHIPIIAKLGTKPRFVPEIEGEAPALRRRFNAEESRGPL
jgi:hypothetical protein